MQLHSSCVNISKADEGELEQSKQSGVSLRSQKGMRQ